MAISFSYYSIHKTVQKRIQIKNIMIILQIKIFWDPAGNINSFLVLKNNRFNEYVTFLQGMENIFGIFTSTNRFRVKLVLK